MTTSDAYLAGKVVIPQTQSETEFRDLMTTLTTKNSNFLVFMQKNKILLKKILLKVVIVVIIQSPSGFEVVIRGGHQVVIFLISGHQ